MTCVEGILFMAVIIPAGDKAATKVYSPYLFKGVQSDLGFMKMNTGTPPKISDQNQTAQSNSGAPIVVSTDLGKGIADTIRFSLVDIFEGNPIMGDENLQGKFMSTTQSHQEVRIDQSRFAIESTKMTGFRTPHDLRKIGLDGLSAISARLENQRCLIHMAGARGSQDLADWAVPFQTSPKFNQIMVNPVLAPTKNRHFFAGGKSKLSDLTITDVLGLDDIGTLGAMLMESEIPMRSATFEADMWAANKPLYILWVSRRQWELIKRPTAAIDWNTAVTNAMKRYEGAKAHPLFTGEGIVWNGILVKPMDRYAIRFLPNDKVIVDDGGIDGKSYNEVFDTIPNINNFHVDRAILVGASALMKAYGSGGSGAAQSWKYFETLGDHDNRLEQSMSVVEGASKIRFKMKGADTDFGVAVIDSYAPPMNSAEWNAAKKLA
jgi:hypothetical protein